MTARRFLHVRLARALSGALPITLAVALAGCSDAPRECTAELRLVTVRVSAPDGTLVDRVTAENRSENECEYETGAQDPQPGGEYWCGEQGGGSYEFRAYVGDRYWSKTVDIDHNGCHIVGPSEPVEIEIEGEGEPADS